MAAQLSPEFLFVCACCQWPRDAGNLETIAARAAGLDWARVAAIAWRHRVEALVVNGMTQAQIARDEPALARMRAAAAGRIRENLVYAAATATLQRDFDRAEIPLSFAKGLPLAMLAYGSLALKASRDVDLLVAPADIARSGDVLSAAGYVRVDPGDRLAPEDLGKWHRFNKETSWLDARTGVLIELHSRLLDNPTISPEIDRADDVIDVEVCPGFLTVRTLSIPLYYAYLSAHGASHGWSRLKWVADLAALMRSNGVSIPELHEMACRLGVGRCSAQALLLAADLIALPVPANMLARLRRNTVNRITYRVAVASFSGKYETEEHQHRTIEAPATLASQFVLRHGLRGKLSQLKWMTINPYDRARELLPPRLAFLYPFITLGRWTRRLISLPSKV